MQVNRWLGVFAGDAVTDLMIAGFAGSIILRTKAPLGRRLGWYTPFGIRIGVTLWAGFRLLSIDTVRFTQDPTLELWLFITLNQIHVMLALLSAAVPGLRKTLQDFMTRHGPSSDSRSGSKPSASIALNKLRSERSGTHSVKPLRMSRNKMEAESAGDGDSQDGIIRQDEFEIRYENSQPSDREPEGDARRW